jgi:beta-lactamase regulating signal transducer with metallopeptidase domain
MTAMTHWLNQTWTHHLIMTLIHSLWQGALTAALLYGLLNTLQKARPQARYLAGMSALFTLLICVFATFALLRLDAPAPTPLHTLENTQVPDAPGTAAPLPVQLQPPHAYVQTARPVVWQTWIFYVWTVGVCAMLVRMVGLLLGVHRLTCQSAPVEEPAVLRLIDSLRDKLRIRPSILTLTGATVQSPGVIGVFRPVLLLPLSLATGVPSEDLTIILWHELAHIRRHDYLVNFFQMVIEALLFFNPAVWWINRHIRLEREACCDALAVHTSGQRLRYAKLLVHWSRQVAGSNGASVVAGFSQSAKQSLVERVKRIALPDHSPRMHLNLLSIAGLFLLSVLVLVGLWKTTDTAVVCAAKILTPADRAHQIDRIDQTFGAQAVTSKPEVPVTITGTVRAQDGSDLPDDFYLSILGQNPRLSSSSGTRVKNGKFHHTMMNYYDAFYLLVERLDFAPTYAGPFHAEPGETVKEIDIVLTHGFRGLIDIVNDRGMPIENAVTKGNYHVFDRFWGGSQDIGELVSDANGRITIAKAITRPMDVNIRAPGYQFVRNLSVAVEPNAPTRLTLATSTPTTGIILDEQTGRPIPNASLRLWQDHTRQTYAEGRGAIWATTDALGQFTLDTLTQGAPYTFIIETPDHQYTRMKQVTMGDTDRMVHLKPKRHVQGIVLGDPPTKRIYNRETKTWQYVPTLTFRTSFSGEHIRHNDQVELSDANDHFTFAITDVYGDTLHFETGDQTRKVVFQDKDTEELIIDLRPVNERIVDANQTRIVVLQFNPPAGFDCNDTLVSVSALSQADRNAGHWGQWNKHAIGNNQIQLTVPAPGLLGYGRGYFDPFNREGTFLRTFWIEGKNQIPIPSGDSPYVIDVPFHPAGTIYGKIQLPTRTLAQHSSQDVSIQLLAIARPDYMASRKGDLEILTNSHWHPSDRYALAPVPLGGTYVVVSRYLFGWTMSRAFSVKEGTSIVQYDLNFTKGVDVTGTVLSDKRQPMAQMPVSLGLESKIGKQGWRTGHHIIHTDHEGRFCFEGVNPDIAGSYTLKIKGSDDYEPVEMTIKPRTRPYQIQLTPAVSASGRIVNGQGQPLSGLTVHANEKTKRTLFYQAAIASPSDRNGQFKLKGLKHKSQYELRVQGHSLLRKILITAASHTDVTLTVID